MGGNGSPGAREARVVDQDTGKIKTDKDSNEVYESVLLAEDEFGRIELVKVGGKQKSKTFRTKALADNFLFTLRQAAKRGEAFNVATGLPESMSGPEKDVGPSFLDFARSFMASRWLHSAARTRETDTYALLSLIPALVKDLPGRPADEELRAVLRDYALLPEGRRGDLAADRLPVLRWMEAASLPLAALQEPRIVRTALDAGDAHLRWQGGVGQLSAAEAFRPASPDRDRG
ncbi:hypothetical protein [Streptosporangium roseum]|uniref:hypothetical protein n=1 Tax=Streptosporangium roseum TaxID=2001 RepID=UPI00331AE525